MFIIFNITENKNKQVNVRLTEKEKELLDNLAKENNTTLSKLLRVIISEYLVKNGVIEK